MEITRIAGGGLFLSQSFNVKDVLRRFAVHIGAQTTKFYDSATPMDHELKLHKVDAINLKFNDLVEIEKNGERVPPNTPYRNRWEPT